jgi:predicted aspartyl protease
MRTIRPVLAIAILGVLHGAHANAYEPERATPSPPRTVLPEEPVVVPMDLHQSQPVLHVHVNGQGPFKFLFDTGAGGHGRISAELADKLGLKESGEVVAGDPSGQNRQAVKLVALDSITIGAAEFHGLELLRRDNKRMIDESRLGIEGILGFGLFADCLITVDYPGNKFVIEKGELPADKSIGYSEPNGVPEITITLGDVPVQADVDSGSMGRLAVPKTVADKLKLKREPVVVGRASTGFNEFEIREAPLDGSVRVGEHSLDNPSIEIFDIFPRANIGGQFLRNFRVAIDQRNKRIQFDAARKTVEPDPKYRVGIMLRREPTQAIVDNVVPGSPADRQGVQAGDRITHVNDTAIMELDQDRLSQLFGSPTPLRLTILRGEKKHEIEVTPARAE